MSKPITPEEVLGLKKAAIPPEVFAAFNALIVLNWRGSSARLRQDDVVAHIAKLLPGKNPFDEGWLDVEDAYREAGWDVDYDKPAFNETYPATFTFSRATKGIP